MGIFASAKSARTTVLLALAGFSCLAGSAAIVAWNNWITKPPLQMRISLVPFSRVSSAIYIPLPEPYTLELQFARKHHTPEQLKILLGDTAQNGERVIINWLLKDAETQVTALNGDKQAAGIQVWSNQFVAREVAKFEVAPGAYLFSATLRSTSSKLEALDPELVLRWNPKDASSWQTGIFWWGGILGPFLLWPTSAILLIVVAIRVLRHNSDQSTSDRDE